MMERDRIIREFRNMLNSEILNCVKSNIDFEDILQYERLLILQSCPMTILAQFVKKIYDMESNLDVIVFGTTGAMKQLKHCNEREILWKLHDKRFDSDDRDVLDDIVKEQAPEAILFFNNYVNCVDFVNIEDILCKYDSTIPIYSYSYVQGELNRHYNLFYHLRGEILYKSLVEWFQTFEVNY